MGIKMSKAWCKSQNEEVVAGKATDKMRKDKDLKCLTESCSAQVTWVERHRKISDSVTRFFRLLPDEKHSMSCKYNTKGRVEVIAKKSDKKIMSSLSNGKYKFRLNLVTNDLKSKNPTKSRIKDDTKNDVSEDKKDKKFVSKGKLKPYLSLMKDIMKLRSEVEKDSDLENLLQLSYNKSDIAWKYFYFDLDDVKRLYKYIESEGYSSNRFKRINHPICVEFQIRDESINEHEGVYYINAKQRKYAKPDVNKEAHIYNLNLRTTSTDVIDEIKEQLKLNSSSYIDFAVYFIPYITDEPGKYSKEHEDGTVTLVYHTVEGWINYKEQIATI